MGESRFPVLVDRLAEMALNGILREYPNKLDHVINGPDDLLSPRALHPAFFGCYDWHSAVHGHWTLVRLLRLHELSVPGRKEVREAVSQNLTAGNIAQEVAYLSQPNRESFERPYGWAWLLMLAAELHLWSDEGHEDGELWAKALQPLEEAIVERFRGFLTKQTYPIRHGVHSNTAFSLILCLSYATAVGDHRLLEEIKNVATLHFGKDASTGIEPSGADFLSPTLTVAALMQRVLSYEEFCVWFNRVYSEQEWLSILEPAFVSDRDDPQIGHLDGLNFSRSWCLWRIADGIFPGHKAWTKLPKSAAAHFEAARPSLNHENYNGQHWLGTFALLAATDH